MINFKFTPIELGKELPKDLYNKMDSKWKWELSTKRQIRGTTLARTMSNLGKTNMSIALREYAKKFVPKKRAYKILQIRLRM